MNVASSAVRICDATALSKPALLTSSFCMYVV
jgi:hypothetical protein